MKECPGQVRVPRVHPPVDIIPYERPAACRADFVKDPVTEIAVRAVVPCSGRSLQESPDTPPVRAGTVAVDHRLTLQGSERDPVTMVIIKWFSNKRVSGPRSGYGDGYAGGRGDKPRSTEYHQKIYVLHIRVPGMEKVCSIAEVPAGSMKGFTINGKQILIANTEGSFFAIDAVCSHMQGYLPAGKLSGKTVTCPVHGAQYDLLTGKVLTNVPWILKMATHRNAADLRTYAIEVKDGQLFVDA